MAGHATPLSEHFKPEPSEMIRVDQPCVLSIAFTSYPKLTITRYCHRCKRLFPNFTTFHEHKNGSPRHPGKCPECHFDGPSWNALLEHCREKHCRIACQGCNNGQGRHWGLVDEAYYEHLKTENVCERCARHFATSEDLDQVRHVALQTMADY
jgi:hypothetical protein